MSYENVVGGKLRLKGKPLLVRDGAIAKKKKKHKINNKQSHHYKLTGRNSGDAADQAEATKKEDAGSKYKDHLTAAERRYLQHLAELDNQRMVKMASKSHRDRIHEFNHYLANLTEHYAIPKVGPG
ncbi:Protein FAM32A-like [Linum grandiflorum]